MQATLDTILSLCARITRDVETRASHDSLALCDTIVSEVEERHDSLRAAADYWSSMGGDRSAFTGGR